GQPACRLAATAKTRADLQKTLERRTFHKTAFLHSAVTRMIRKILPLHSLLTSICLYLGKIVCWPPVQTELWKLPGTGVFQIHSGSRSSIEAGVEGRGLSVQRRRPLFVIDTLEEFSVEVKETTA